MKYRYLVFHYSIFQDNTLFIGQDAKNNNKIHTGKHTHNKKVWDVKIGKRGYGRYYRSTRSTEAYKK